jgi:hypothetical protein
MGKKGNLLTEGQVRQFMKLANLEAITPGFIHGLNEVDTDWSPKKPGKGPAPKFKDIIDKEPPKKKGEGKPDKELKKPEHKPEGVEESHGRGKDEGPAGYGKPDQNARLREQEDDWDVEDAEDDLEHAEDLEVDAEEDLGDVGLEGDVELGPGDGGQQVSIDDFLAALEIALEDVLGDEVEVDQEEDVEAEDEEVELPLGGEEELDVGLDVEEEPALQEMINQITRRVAKRIVKEALHGKK